MIPDKETANFVVGIDKLFEINQNAGVLSELKERVYVFADYLPPGKHNTCLLYNSVNKPKKGMYTFFTRVKPREKPLKLSKRTY
jgi:hypothetical protein